MADDLLVSALQSLVQATNAQTQALAKVLAAVQSTATTATAGSAALPSAPAGFLNSTRPDTGAAIKVPFYNA